MSFFYIIVLVIGSVQSTVRWKYLPENMEPFCPSKNICDRNTSVDFPKLRIPAHLKRCCSDCSCEATCGQTNEKCCFPKMDRHTKPDRSLQECISPTSVTKKLYMLPAFFMDTRSSSTGTTPSGNTDSIGSSTSDNTVSSSPDSTGSSPPDNKSDMTPDKTSAATHGNTQTRAPDITGITADIYGSSTPAITERTENTSPGITHNTGATTPDITDNTGPPTPDITYSTGTSKPNTTDNIVTSTSDIIGINGSSTPDIADNTGTSKLDPTDPTVTSKPDTTDATSTSTTGITDITGSSASGNDDNTDTETNTTDNYGSSILARTVTTTPGINGNTDTTTPHNTDNTDAGVPCGEVNVTSFGSIYPVYSMKSRKIYKNQVCAHEDGMYELIYWNMYLRCQNTDRHFSLSQFHLQYIASAPNCEVMFKPPDEIVDLIQRDICYNDVIDTCNEEMVYEGDILTHEEVVNACESGFFSPFIKHAVYANVFCFMCNKGRFEVGKQLCDLSTWENFLRPLRLFPILTTILNMNVDTSESRPAKDPRQRTACFEDEKGRSCKAVLCSSGRTYNKNGECVFSFASLYGMAPKITLFLQPSEYIGLSELKSLSESKLTIKEWLKSPWPKGWKVITVSVRRTNDTVPNAVRQAESIVMEVIYANDFVPQELRDTIFRRLRRSVTICTHSRCVNARQTLAPYAEFRKRADLYIPIWQFAISNEQRRYPVEPKETAVFEVIYFVRYHEATYNLGKTFLCDQIEPLEDEYELLADNLLLYYKKLNLFFYNNEFDLILTQPGSYTARVCMDVAGFTEEVGTENKGSGLRYQNRMTAFSVILTIAMTTVYK